MRLWTKIKLIFAGLVSAVAIVGAIILRGKIIRPKKTTVKVIPDALKKQEKELLDEVEWVLKKNGRR